MNSIKYFYINNQKFNYNLEFQNNHTNNYWKHNAPLIEYCETLGINIPHYCYHKNLSISGNCRMCLVELKNSPKPMVSCAMSAKSCLNNSEIFTDSPLVKKARENIMEFLLLNHPLDCPICDQGGECDLQDQSLYFGITKKRFYNFKRIVTDKNIGPVVKTVMTRCIHCTRCVRFSTEIAGTEDLGMFGRGLKSEIGTYVSKTFQSELSGNVIDLCPVGALTSKPYPFLSRSWELKTINSIDFSDGFGIDLQVSLKNNKVVKINPGYNSELKTNPWISDKTRFSFDGMFSPERILKGFIKFGRNSSKTSKKWKTLMSEIISTIYFQDHLNKHFFKNKNLIVIFNNNISLEVLTLLTMFSKKYKFIKLRKFERQEPNVNLESDFLMKPKIGDSLLNSNLCLLIGLNSRYEGSQLNLKLRKRLTKGDFKLLTLGPSKDLTFPSLNLGTGLNNLKKIAEGNSPICQIFTESKQPVFIVSSSIFDRTDSNSIMLILKLLSSKLKNFHFNWNNINILNSSLNETGVKYLNCFKTVSDKDFLTNSGFYFINTNPNTLNFQKLIKLKLLNYINTNTNNWPNYIFEQNYGIHSSVSKIVNKTNKIYNYINLPNNVFFESTGTFLTTEGTFKTTVKFISTKNQTKEDWQIIRKIFSTSSKITFLFNNKNNFKLSFNMIKFNKFKLFTKILYTATNCLDKTLLTSFNNNITLFNKKTLTKFKHPKTKFFSTKFKIWINDFYVGGLDSYSLHSATMINCSKTLRIEKNNFSHII